MSCARSIANAAGQLQALAKKHSFDHSTADTVGARLEALLADMEGKHPPERAAVYAAASYCLKIDDAMTDSEVAGRLQGRICRWSTPSRPLSRIRDKLSAQ